MIEFVPLVTVGCYILYVIADELITEINNVMECNVM